MLSRIVRLGSKRVVLTAINPRQYGHLALEAAMSLAIARREGAALCFLRPAQVVSEVLLQLETDEVRIWPRGPMRDVLAHSVWAMFAGLTKVGEMWRYNTFVLGHEFRREIVKYQRGESLDGKSYRTLQLLVDRLPRGRRRKSREMGFTDRTARRLYYRRRLLRAPVSTRLPERLAPNVAEGAARVGLDLDRPLVTVHVREAGYKLGREMHQAKPGGRNDSTRNARLETYFEAIDRLVADGYTVVRIGDPSMTPVNRPGVVDLATSPHRSQLLEIACMLRARFFLSGEAGPVGVSYLTNTPLLTVNATDPISSYPVRADGLLLLKHVVERKSRRELTVDELVSEAHLRHLRDLLFFEYVENTSAEIASAVEEMLTRLDGHVEETAGQRRFRELATGAATALAGQLQYVRKWGADEGFLGDGRIVRGPIA